MLLLFVWVCLSLYFGGPFFYDSLEDLAYVTDLGFFSLFYAYNWKVCFLYDDPYFHVFLPSSPQLSVVSFFLIFHVPYIFGLDSVV